MLVSWPFKIGRNRPKDRISRPRKAVASAPQISRRRLKAAIRLRVTSKLRVAGDHIKGSEIGMEGVHLEVHLRDDGNQHPTSNIVHTNQIISHYTSF